MRCPYCESTVTGDPTPNRRHPHRRPRWWCGFCRRRFTALTGGPHHNSKLQFERMAALLQLLVDEPQTSFTKAKRQVPGLSSNTWSRIRRQRAGT